MFTMILTCFYKLYILKKVTRKEHPDEHPDIWVKKEL